MCDYESLFPSTFHLRRRTPGSFVLVPCPRLGRSLRCQGQLEAAAARILAACPLVAQIQEQPFSIWYRWSDENPQIQILENRPTTRSCGVNKFSYIVPDFAVNLRSGASHLLEIKPYAQLAKPRVQRKLAAARAFAQQTGSMFSVLTERELLRGPLLDNVRLLGRFITTEVDPHLSQEITTIVAQGPMTIHDLEAQLASRWPGPQTKAAILHLAATGAIDIDPRAASIHRNTLIHPGGTVLWDPFDSVWGPSGSSKDAPIA